MEYGESVEQCARRELLEETGLNLGTYVLGPYTNDIFHEVREHYVTLLIISTDSQGEPVNREPNKCEGWSWHSWDHLPRPMFLPLQNLVSQGFRLHDA